MEALLPAPVGADRFVIRATHERGVGVPSSRSLATATREAVFSLGGQASTRACGVALGVNQDLGVRLGIAERVEGVLDAVQPDGPGDQRGDVDLAVGEHVERVAELERRIAEHEAQVNLFRNRH